MQLHPNKREASPDYIVFIRLIGQTQSRHHWPVVQVVRNGASHSSLVRMQMALTFQESYLEKNPESMFPN